MKYKWEIRKIKKYCVKMIFKNIIHKLLGIENLAFIKISFN